MALDNIEAKKIFVPLKEPFKYALDTLTKLPYILVTLKDDDFTGIGEAATAIDITGETQESVIKIIEFIKPLIEEKQIENINDIKKILEVFDTYVVNNQAARSGIEMALFDLLGKKINKPIYKILGGKNKKTIKIQRTFGFFNENNLEKEIKNSIEVAKNLEADIIKYKVGLNKKYDLALVKFARKYAPKMEIVLDVNQGWKNLKQADSMFSGIKKYNIGWIEQPLPSHDYDGMSALRKKYKIPIMVDEGMKSIEDCELIKFKKAADLINIKITKVGGFLKAKEIINFCERNGIKYMLGDMIHTNIGMAANLHLATMGNFVSFDIDNTRIKNDIAEGITNNDLEYQIPQGPGLGVKLK